MGSGEGTAANLVKVAGTGGVGGPGALERIRTSDPQLRKLVLYPLSYERG